MNLPTLAGVCCLATLLPFYTFATAAEQPALTPSQVLLNADGSNDHWNGIGRIKSKTGSQCTATLLDTRSPESPPDAPAYVLTSGHCIDKQVGTIITDRAVEGSMTFNFFTDSTPRSHQLKRINWSSMQGVDLAIVELQPSLESLIAKGIRPIRIASEVPEPGREILWVGAPLHKDTGHLRMAACVHQTSGEILEQPWVWRNTVANQCRDVDTGASGSPMLIRDSAELYAVLNFTNQSSAPSTPANQRDELAPGFPSLPADSNFGNPVTLLNRCFVKGILSTAPEQCSLFPTFSVDFETLGKQPAQYARVRLDTQGNVVYPGWELRFLIDTPFYRYKKVTSAQQCENPVDYSPAIAAQDAAINDPVDTRIGINWLCIVGVTSEDERPAIGLMRNALTLAMELQPAGPTPAPVVKVQKTRFGTYTVSWSHEPALIDYYTVKTGPPQSTDCNDPEGFKGRFSNLVVRPQSLPLKICTYAHDVNDQPSVLREDVIPAP
ncbi:trypsin [Pseudomonas floridensis]|uniref:Trypsin n=1 Tax=Pseudomonas floridensis TaxID=1958950 RepID=A0A1X0MZF9_9PSED|nr:trypsin-like serine protease [Pseudomonas floridensis]ORC55098.1 trypsin [Pseudomonas floridensis]